MATTDVKGQSSPPDPAVTSQSPAVPQVEKAVTGPLVSPSAKPFNGLEVVGSGTLTLDIAAWPKTEGMFSAAYKCFVLDASPKSVWIIEATAPTAMQTVTVTLLRDGDCAAGNTIAPLQGKFAFPAKTGGGAYIVYISSVGRSDPVSLTVTQLTADQAHQLADVIELPKGPLATQLVQKDETLSPSPVLVASVQSLAYAEIVPGTIIRDCNALCPELVVLPSGNYFMGSASSEVGRSANEGPRHEVMFVQGFAMGLREITFAEWDNCVAENGCPAIANDNGWGRGRRPVINVSFKAALGYVAWLSKKTGERYFLPSEAEWEYAARAMTESPWHTGEKIIPDDANILNQYRQAVPVGSFPPNAFGLFDMHGNVAEWTQDCDDIGYFGVPTDGSIGVSSKCGYRMTRGGSFESAEKDVRSARRLPQAMEAELPTVGFRIARAIRPPVQQPPTVIAAASGDAIPPVSVAQPAPESAAVVAAPAAAIQPPITADVAAAPVKQPVAPPQPEQPKLVSAKGKSSAPAVETASVNANQPRMKPGNIRDTLEIVERVAQSQTQSQSRTQPSVSEKTASQSVPPVAAIPAKEKPVVAKAKEKEIVLAAKSARFPPAQRSTAFVTEANAQIARIRSLRRQGLELVERGKVEAAISSLKQALTLAKGTDLFELLTLDLDRAHKIKDMMSRNAH
jgi:formylglycine-generating enzyme required for sulfatase activity